MPLNPGLYTAHVTGQNGATGLSLVEAYDADLSPSSGSRAIAISTRGHVGAGQDVLIAGVVIGGDFARRVLIRAPGPALAGAGVSNALAEPQLTLFDRSGTVLQTAGAWSAQLNADEIRDASIRAGALTFAPGSKDAALITTLTPGPYTVQVSGANGATGIALVEVYDLP